jgi:hypothetical protein
MAARWHTAALTSHSPMSAEVSELGKGSTFTFTAVLGLAATESAAASGARRT